MTLSQRHFALPALASLMLVSVSLDAQSKVLHFPQGSRVDLSCLPGVSGNTILAINGENVSSWQTPTLPLLQRREVTVRVMDTRGREQNLPFVLIPKGLSVLTGSANSGEQARDGIGLAARFSAIKNMTKGPDGSLYVIDGHAIRKIDPEGNVKTVAGNVFSSGYVDSVNDGQGNIGNAGQERFYLIDCAIAVDKQNGIYVADLGNNVIRYIHPEGSVKTVAGHNTPNLNTFLTNKENEVNSGDMAPDGKNYPKGLLRGPKSLCILNNGDVIIQEQGNAYSAKYAPPKSMGNRFLTRKYDPKTGKLSTHTAFWMGLYGELDKSSIVGSYQNIDQVRAGNGSNIMTDGLSVYQIQHSNYNIPLLYPMGSRTFSFPFWDKSATLSYTNATISTSGIWFTCAVPTNHASIFKYNSFSDTTPSLIYGFNGATRTSDGSKEEAGFHMPRAIAQGADGAMYVAADKAIRRIGHDGIVTHWAGISPMGSNLKSPDASLLGACFGSLHHLAVSPQGQIYVADTNNHALRSIDNHTKMNAKTQTLMGTYGKSGKLDATGKLQLNYPKALATSPTGYVFVADSQNKRICQLSPSGESREIAALTFYPISLAWGGNNTLYARDNSNNLHIIDTQTGQIQPFTAINAICKSKALATDAKGRVFTADAAGNCYCWSHGNNGWSFESMPKLNGDIRALAIDPSGKYLYCAAQVTRPNPTTGKGSFISHLVYRMEAQSDGTWDWSSPKTPSAEPGHILGRLAESNTDNFQFNGPAPFEAYQPLPSVQFPGHNGIDYTFSMAVHPNGDLLIPSVNGILLASGIE